MGGPLLSLLFFLPSILADDGNSGCPLDQACLQVSLCKNGETLEISTIHVKHGQGPPKESTCGTFVRLGFKPSITEKWKIHVTNTIEWNFELHILGDLFNPQPGKIEKPGDEEKKKSKPLVIKLDKPSDGAKATTTVPGGTVDYKADRMADYDVEVFSTEYDNLYDRLYIKNTYAYVKIAREGYRFNFNKNQFNSWFTDLKNTLKACKFEDARAGCNNGASTECKEMKPSGIKLKCPEAKLWVEMDNSTSSFLSKTVICEEGAWRIKEDGIPLNRRRVVCANDDSLYKKEILTTTHNPNAASTTPEPVVATEITVEDVEDFKPTPLVMEGGGNGSLMIGLIIGLLVVLIIAVVGIVYWRMSKQKKRKRGHKKGKKKGRKGKKRGNSNRLEVGGETGTGTGTTGATGTGTTGSETTTGATGTEATSPYTGTATGTQTQTTEA